MFLRHIRFDVWLRGNHSMISVLFLDSYSSIIFVALPPFSVVSSLCASLAHLFLSPNIHFTSFDHPSGETLSFWLAFCREWARLLFLRTVFFYHHLCRWTCDSSRRGRLQPADFSHSFASIFFIYFFPQLFLCGRNCISEGREKFMAKKVSMQRASRND